MTVREKNEYKNELDEAYQDKHTHENKEVLDELGESQVLRLSSLVKKGMRK